MPDWNYGDAYLRHPCPKEPVIFSDGSIVQARDIFDPLPPFMEACDMIFTDSPWNRGNLRSFYTKADLPFPAASFESFMTRLFECVELLHPPVCYLEIGKDHLADYIVRLRRLYKYVTFYNSTYYHRGENLCYIVRGSDKASKPKLDGMDEEAVISWVCANEDYSCVGDLCIGRGLVAVAAAKNGKRFVGTELNHKRLSVLMERVTQLGLSYKTGGDHL